VKGLSNFLYIWTHWDTISEEQKKRDERLQAVEDLGQQMIRLREQVHEEEKRALERKMDREREEWRALAGRGADALDTVMVKLEEVERLGADLRRDLSYAVGWLTIVLYAEVDPAQRDHVVSKLPSPLRERVSRAIARLAEEAPRGPLPKPAERNAPAERPKREAPPQKLPP
jgi:hypothetical protein